MERRSLLFVILISIVTLGIYDVYWLFVTRNELVQKGYKVPSPWLVLAPLLGLIAVALLQIIAHFVFANETGGTNLFERIVNILSLLIGFLSIFGIIPMSLYWTWQYCKAAEGVTKGALSAGLNFTLAIILAIVGLNIIWPAIVQSYFNKVSA